MQTYVAKSIFVSSTFWVNVGMFIVAILELREVMNIIPDEYNGAMAAVAAIVNVALRFNSVRPVALMAPSETKNVSVETLPAGH